MSATIWPGPGREQRDDLVGLLPRVARGIVEHRAHRVASAKSWAA
jgi:hypothetical protein